MRRIRSAATAATLGTAALLAGVLSGVAVENPYVADVTVAQPTAPDKGYFPSVVRTATGELIAVYRQGNGHVDSSTSTTNARIMLTRSTDDGQTWTTPIVAVDTPFDDRDPMITQVSSGDLLLNYFVADWWTDPALPSRQTYVVRSADDGATWSAPVAVGGGFGDQAAPDSEGYRTGSNGTHGQIVELPDGDLLLPVYGSSPGHPRYSSGFVRSTDGGLTWASTPTIAAQDPSVDFTEGQYVSLGTGEVAALFRTNGTTAYLGRSGDGGATWSSPVPLGLPAYSAHLLKIAAGSVLLTYGDASGRFGPPRPTVARLIEDPGGDWNAYPDLLLYDAWLTADQANPSSVEIAPGEFLTLTYNTNTGAVVGKYSDTSDYANICTAPCRRDDELDLAAMLGAGSVSIATDLTHTQPGFGYHYAPQRAIDGNDNYFASATANRAAGAPLQFTLTFDDPVTVDEIGLNLKPNYPESATVQVSDDGVAWGAPVVSVTGAVTNSTVWHPLSSARTFRHVRVVITDSFGNWGQLTELRLAT